MIIHQAENLSFLEEVPSQSVIPKFSFKILRPINTRKLLFKELSYRDLGHSTDAFIEVKAGNLREAFAIAGQSVVDITLDSQSVEEKEQKEITVSGKDLRYLLLNWLEEVIFQLITEGFAIHRFSLEILKNSEYKINAIIFGEEINLEKHHFKVEIKAPTFHLMEIIENDEIILRYLLDL